MRWDGGCGGVVWGLILLMPLVVLLTVMAPARSLMAWAGLARPFELMARPTLPALVVTPGNVEVLRGSDVPMEVSAPGRTTVTVHWQAAGDVELEELIELDGDRGSFVLRRVTARTDYWVQAPDGAMSPQYQLQPVDPLLVGDLIVRISFPPHTGRSPEEYGVVVPPLRIPVRSVFSFEGQASRPLLSAGLERRDGEAEGDAEAEAEAGAEVGAGAEAEITVNGRGFEGRWTPRVSGIYEWRFTGVDGEPGEILPATPRTHDGARLRPRYLGVCSPGGIHSSRSPSGSRSSWRPRTTTGWTTWPWSSIG